MDIQEAEALIEEACKHVGGARLRAWIEYHLKPLGELDASACCPMLAVTELTKTGGLIPSDDYWWFASGFDARCEEQAGANAVQKLGYKFRRRVLNGDFDTAEVAL